MLEALTRAPLPAARLWAARKAAGRGLHGPALRGGGDDPYVLARLGLHDLAAEARGSDARARLGRAIAAAALGGDVEAPEGDEARALVAAALAPGAPARAALLLPEERRLARAACWLAAGRNGEAADSLADAHGAEAETIRAALAARTGDPEQARRAINAMFGAHGLAPPLEDGRGSIGLDDYRSAALAPRDGPLVSVITPLHDNEDTIVTTLESLIAQSWRGLEILVVDDRSGDRGPELVRALAERDPRLALTPNARAPGAYGARNTGIAAAKGEYVAFLDADDWSPPERIARQMALASRAAVVTSNHIRVDEDGAPIAPRVFPLIRYVPITMLLRRETMIAAGPFDEVPTGADSEMMGRLTLRHGRRAIARDPAVLLVARWRRGSLSEAGEGGMLGEERLAYRARWMFRQAGLEAPRGAA